MPKRIAGPPCARIAPQIVRLGVAWGDRDLGLRRGDTLLADLATGRVELRRQIAFGPLYLRRLLEDGLLQVDPALALDAMPVFRAEAKARQSAAGVSYGSGKIASAKNGISYSTPRLAAREEAA